MAGPKAMKEDVMNACEGMLQKQLYVVFTTPTAGPFWNDDETE